MVPERKLSKVVISSGARNLMALKIREFKDFSVVKTPSK